MRSNVAWAAPAPWPFGRNGISASRRLAPVEVRAPLHLERRSEQGGLVIAVSGDLDVESAEDFRVQVESWLLESDANRLVLNLERVGFIDSTGLGAILGRYRRLRETGRQMALVAPPPAALAVLEMGGVPELMRLFPSDAKALAVSTS